KKFALLQTPVFVEEFILDRTLEPALEEFGLAGDEYQPRNTRNTRKEEAAGALPHQENDDERDAKTQDLRPKTFRLIDPACGSGHFLLGAFPRLLSRWQRQEPRANVRDLVQRALDAVYGVDVNPYAIAIARFRLLLAALRACGIARLADAPAFQLNLVCGDSLLHGSGEQQSFGWRDVDHATYAEDLAELRRILVSGRYHAVVANPPYITPKDRALNSAYRERYSACHMKYSLSVPFMERIFRLAIEGGFTGQITANSFMKREFGKKLIEQFLPTIDLTHVIDTSGAYIPGHGTPTVILFGRRRKPLAGTIRTVMGIRGEPSTPDDPSKGLVWSAVVDQVDQPSSLSLRERAGVRGASEFVSVADSPRERFAKHPWSIGGGGAAELKEQLDESAEKTLSSLTDSIGITSFTLEDDIYILPQSAARRVGMNAPDFRTMIVGDALRDWVQGDCEVAVFPYDGDFEPVAEDSHRPSQRYLWRARTCLANNKMFGGRTKVECGLKWYEYGRLTSDKLRTPLSIVYGEVATHNHFVLDRGGKVFKQTAPVIKLPAGATPDDHLALLGLLNSSTACFWLKQVCHNKGSTVDQHGARQRTDPFEDFFAFNATKLEQFPLPEG
ncbi:MAG TPA: BREX-2 system adenine-specific DNA-methyltransferase PglX, partial [Pirellulales bacterium]|nr:BREX-2 system adenine-specific DNA-methyltransferase PglX [Pirellulales bacterium]